MKFEDRRLDQGLGKAVARRTYLRRLTNPETGRERWEKWSEVAERVALGNTLLIQGDKKYQKAEYKILRKHISNGSLLMSGRHLQHGDDTQPGRNMEVFTNCSTAASSFILFYLLV